MSLICRVWRNRPKKNYYCSLQKIVVKIDGCHSAGFEEDVLAICCGGPGTLFCGVEGSYLCKKPSARLFWDGVHLTEVAYRYIADGWLGSIDSPTREGSYQSTRWQKLLGFMEWPATLHRETEERWKQLEADTTKWNGRIKLQDKTLKRATLNSQKIESYKIEDKLLAVTLTHGLYVR
jgi:hypothetical protein